jgi:hypothetical protein
MADTPKYPHRDYRGTEGVVEDAQRAGPPDEGRKLPRGRVGASRGQSPRRGVRDPGKPHTGSEGEPSYGAPMNDKPEDRGKK